MKFYELLKYMKEKDGVLHSQIFKVMKDLEIVSESSFIAFFGDTDYTILDGRSGVKTTALIQPIFQDVEGKRCLTETGCELLRLLEQAERYVR